jgi:hypothetical protein
MSTQDANTANSEDRSMVSYAKRAGTYGLVALALSGCIIVRVPPPARNDPYQPPSASPIPRKRWRSQDAFRLRRPSHVPLANGGDGKLRRLVRSGKPVARETAPVCCASTDLERSRRDDGPSPQRRKSKHAQSDGQFHGERSRGRARLCGDDAQRTRLRTGESPRHVQVSS